MSLLLLLLLLLMMMMVMTMMLLENRSDSGDQYPAAVCLALDWSL